MEEKKRIELIVSYDGTNYCGWQIQKNGITVEEILNRELRRLLHEDVAVIGASRTDSGVHAKGNIAVFDTKTRIPPEKLCYALNERLPEDIVIQESREVLPDFHPRKCRSRKTYEYRIWNRRFRDPLHRLYSYFVYVPLDLEAMREAAACLEGEHDFASFCSSGSQAATTVRTLYQVSLMREGDLIIIRLTGNGFLYNMVRIIAGTLIKVGMHVYPPSHMKEILEARDRRQAGPKAPAVGLTLMKIEIDENEPHYPKAHE
ncbi:MAG: tRNA pseudouridine(38-40) synthase TruA [Lachnospiraceae bacterium]|jgi:tRNA pseudouridine38-40 synthase|nr:tRNA pseudouridine(38-40) synthase TruA [Lachnospiraceae bacterium]